MRRVAEHGRDGGGIAVGLAGDARDEARLAETPRRPLLAAIVPAVAIDAASGQRLRLLLRAFGLTQVVGADLLAPVVVETAAAGDPRGFILAGAGGDESRASREARGKWRCAFQSSSSFPIFPPRPSQSPS